ncbi:MAG TPA: insulinase family protein [Ardenticatenaceae bacterium]|jgi:hypothetical protein
MAITHGFELLQDQPIPELHTRARRFRHVKTGAELLSLENQDENKVFSITFRTPPTDSTGLPHILEHSVLCGSEKYPLKEPFVELLKGSLQTFLNAFTYPDKTCYPVASQNLQDFYNLIDVYVDAVFHPRITPQILQQEGWHYELDSPDEPMIYKGVVFNEMKGSYASPERALSTYAQSSLFPDTTYGVDSGGDPQVIPDLTYEQFKSFHERYYHPSNARIFFYGDDNPAERLRLMDEYLSAWERQEVDSSIPLQPPFDEPRRVVRAYQVSEGEQDGNKGMVTVNWLLSEVTNTEQTLAFHILEYILIGKPASPLRKALIESGLGEDLAGQGLEGELRQLFFSTGLKGVDVADADRIESLVVETLERLASEGIDAETIEAAINSTEFALRENNTGPYPRGLLLMLRALTYWLHDADPIAPLAFEAPLNALKTRLASGEPLFENLIRDCFLSNRHRTTLILQPDPELARQVEAKERARLDEARAGMSDEEIQRVIEETRALRLAQETPDAPEVLATIPSLQREDLDPQAKQIPLEVLDHNGTQLLYHDIFTNGIAYLDLGLNLHTLPQELLPYVPLYGRALLELGTATEDFVRLSQRIDRKTGGIQPTTLTTVTRGSDEGQAWLFLRGKVMAPQVDDLLDILRDVLLTVQLDSQERFRQMVLEEKAGLEAGLVYNGHRVANRRMKAHFNEADWAAEQMTGVSQLLFLRQLAQEVEGDWSGVLAKLQQIHETLVNRQAMLLNVTVDGNSWKDVHFRLGSFLEALPAAESERVSWSVRHEAKYEGLTIPSPVNYVGKAANLYDLGYQLHGSALVISRYLRSTYMWNQVRVQGGAYGGFSLFDPRSGAFSYLSYRDPNLQGTLRVYDGTSHFLRDLDLSDEELTKSIVGAIGDMDTYLLPDAKGYTSMERYLAGETDEYRQRLRDEVLSTSAANFREFADTLEQANRQGVVAVLAALHALEAANDTLDLEITRVL